ncbi:hypothetical protein MAUB_18620 [Mycolicibacterium aubagnense]|uniref:Secreted protein n=1 Tax=Mycolicibacterium aubagnense TaxID=319707 RepID=A0ABM7IBF3_9MYCO|nr:hypothetical protein MAUB_18620 [Mycolicibacterium aubagnense]
MGAKVSLLVAASMVHASVESAGAAGLLPAKGLASEPATCETAVATTATEPGEAEMVDDADVRATVVTAVI